MHVLTIIRTYLGLSQIALAQAAGIGINAAGLQQNGNLQLLRNRQQRLQIADDLLLIVRKGASRHVRHLGIARNLQQRLQIANTAIILRNVIGRVKARDAQLLFPQLAHSSCGLVFMEMLTYMERASDQCSSIAVMMLARDNDSIMQNHYEYLRAVHEGNDAAYIAEKNRRREQYILPLKEIK